MKKHVRADLRRPGARAVLDAVVAAVVLTCDEAPVLPENPRPRRVTASDDTRRAGKDYLDRLVA